MSVVKLGTGHLDRTFNLAFLISTPDDDQVRTSDDH